MQHWRAPLLLVRPVPWDSSTQIVHCSQLPMRGNDPLHRQTKLLDFLKQGSGVFSPFADVVRICDVQHISFKKNFLFSEPGDNHLCAVRDCSATRIRGLWTRQARGSDAYTNIS